MDNNNSGKPRKRVTKQVLRRRQLTALAVIALIVLIFIILIASACTDHSTKPRDNSKNSTTTSATTTTTTEVMTEPPTTTSTTAPIPTINAELSAQVQLSTRELFLNTGESEMPLIYGYPDGCSEENEIWASSDTNIATVNEMGNVTAINAGECYIILKFNNNPAIEVSIKVTVTGETTPAENQPVVNPEEDINNNPDVPDGQSSYQDTQGYQDTQNYMQNQSQPDEQSFQPQSDISADEGVTDEVQNE